MFQIADEVLALRPDVTIHAVVARGARNAPSGDASRALLTGAAEDAADTDLDHPHLQAWRETFRAFGAKPQRTPSSAEALIKRALGGGLPAVNVLVDTYNAVSVRHAVPIGGEDLAAARGCPRLIRATGDEPFETAAGVEHPRSGEVVWVDDLGVTCRRWNWRQCTRTALTPATTDAYFLLEGLAGYDLTPPTEELLGHLRTWAPDAVITVEKLP